MIKLEKSFGTMVRFQTTYGVIWWSLWYRGSPVSMVLFSDVPGLVQFVNSTKVKKKIHFENLIDQFLAFSAESVPNYCMRFPFAQKLHNPGIFVWAFVLSCLWLRGKLFSTSFSTNCVMSTLSDSFDSCNYTKRNHNLSDYEKKGGFNKNSGLNSLGIFQHRVAVLI